MEDALRIIRTAASLAPDETDCARSQPIIMPTCELIVSRTIQRQLAGSFLDLA